jgi:hypothetical protein
METMPAVMTALAALIGAFAWPAILLIVVIMYRQRIGKLLEKLERVKGPFGTEASFSRSVDSEVMEVLLRNPDPAGEVTQGQVESARRVGQMAEQTDRTVARQQMIDLAREYENVRAAMPAGDSRTRQMELVVTKMRTLAIACQPFLTEFMSSKSPGERLAGIAILQVRSDSRHADWLADRLKAEAPFVGYQAAVALLSAVRNAAPEERSQLEANIRKAKSSLGPEKQRTDRAKTLDIALSELAKPNR